MFCGCSRVPGGSGGFDMISPWDPDTTWRIQSATLLAGSGAPKSSTSERTRLGGLFSTGDTGRRERLLRRGSPKTKATMAAFKEAA